MKPRKNSLSRSALNVMAIAEAEAKRNGKKLIDTEDLLVGLVTVSGVAKYVLL